MSNSEPNIQVPVDLTNPGQFFACCGLLELADRLWPRAEVSAEFTPSKFEYSQFRIFSNRTFDTQSIIGALCNSERTAVDPYQAIKKNGKLVKDISKIKPIRLDIPKHEDLQNEPVSMRLSWWLNEFAGQQRDEFKLWAANVSSESLINDMTNAIHVEKISDRTVLNESLGMTGRIGLDTRSSWNTLDEGFSPNNQNLPVATYPATELLAAVGLQTFLPVEENGYIYTCWTTRIPTIVARGVVSGCINLPGGSRYCFKIGTRGRFGYFTRASELERNTNG